jgi:hypothetical protein
MAKFEDDRARDVMYAGVLKIGGWLIMTPFLLVGLYLLVRFVKWAWTG